MTEVVMTVLAIGGLAVAAAESIALTAMGWLLALASGKAWRHEQRISQLEAEVKQMRKDIDEVDVVVDRTLDVAGVSRNGVLRGKEQDA